MAAGWCCSIDASVVGGWKKVTGIGRGVGVLCVWWCRVPPMDLLTLLTKISKFGTTRNTNNKRGRVAWVGGWVKNILLSF
jgi:hypothetical protein